MMLRIRNLSKSGQGSKFDVLLLAGANIVEFISVLLLSKCMVQTFGL